jgi:DNA-binding CsgD family transcriptional regulator
MSDAITWIPDADHFDANPAATVALDRARWEALGATFTEVDDGDDETPGLAVGWTAADGVEVEFGVLDYGEDSTFLLVPGRDGAAIDSVRSLIATFARAGILDPDNHVLDVSGDGIARVTLEERVAALERRMAEVAARNAPTTTPQHEVLSEARGRTGEQEGLPAQLARLTTREREIVQLAAQGSSNATIAKELWITEQTVKFHLSNAYRKLGISSRAELVDVGRRRRAQA